MGGALRKFPIIYIWLSLDEEKALRKVKEVFRISRRSFQIWTVPMAATAPVTKVYNRDFATRVASMGYLKKSSFWGATEKQHIVMQSFFYSASSLLEFAPS